MAAPTPKRKKLERNAVEEPQEVKPRFYCCKCGKAYSRQKGFFPVSHSPMYRGSGYLPVCNDCIEELYQYYKAHLSSDREAMKRICMKLDLYWHDSIYDMVEKTAGTNSRIRNYIGKTNIIRFIDKTFDDTIEEDPLCLLGQQQSGEFDLSILAKTVKEADIKEEEPEEKIVVDQEIIDFWGTGFSPDFYFELEKRYKDWTDGFTDLDPGEKAIYKQICILETTISRDSGAGKSIDKNVNALNNLLGSANLKPAQKKDDIDISFEKDPLGVWIRRWETTEPLPEVDPELADVDGVVKYIETWFKGHLAKMAGIDNAYSKIYEKEIEKIRVQRPEYEDDDDETVFNNIFDTSEED